VELLPGYAYAIGTRGEVLLALERFSEAIKDMERSVELGVEVTWIRGHLVQAYLARYAATAKKRYFNQAVDLAEAGLRESPRDPDLLTAVGQALHVVRRQRWSNRRPW
jgi:tetratricopeptide (TPR) repeat protein